MMVIHNRLVHKVGVTIEHGERGYRENRKENTNETGILKVWEKNSNKLLSLNINKFY